jgi:cobalt/nickel transport system permease protein
MSGTHRLRSYAHLDSPVHRAAASLKVGLALALVFGVALVPVAAAHWVGLLIVALVGIARVARVPLGAFVGRVAIAEPLVLGVAVLALFQGRGLAVFIAIAVKSTACVTALQLLAHTTPFDAILGVLRRARVPAILVVTLGLLHRYLFVLLEETQRMRRARAARTWASGGPLAWRSITWRALSSVVAVSFVRSVDRAERVYAAMQARGGP